MKLVLGRQNPTFSVVAVQLRADITYSKATVSVIIDERGLNKYARDYINQIDQITLAVNKVLETAQAVEDSSSYALSKAVSDTYSAVDIVTRYMGFNRNYSDSFAVSDTLLGFGIAKGLIDQIASLDALTMSLTKQLADTYAASDVFARVFAANLALADSSLTLDVLASIDVSKLLTDAASAVSSGSLRMTDYADITYFAEDYVGSTRTFS